MATTRETYSPFTLTLHWLTAALVLTQPLLVWLTEEMAREDRREWLGLHKSIGATLLILTLIRLSSRLAGNKAIPLPDTTPDWQKLFARATHVLFYVLLIAMPIVGWAGSTAMGRDVVWFGLFQLPPLPFVPEDREFGRSIMGLHKYAGWTLVTLVVLHILGGLKHYFVDKDNVLQRMLPFLPRREQAGEPVRNEPARNEVV